MDERPQPFSEEADNAHREGIIPNIETQRLLEKFRGRISRLEDSGVAVRITKSIVVGDEQILVGRERDDARETDIYTVKRNHQEVVDITLGHLIPFEDEGIKGFLLIQNMDPESISVHFLDNNASDKRKSYELLFSPHKRIGFLGDQIEQRNLHRNLRQLTGDINYLSNSDLVQYPEDNPEKFEKSTDYYWRLAWEQGKQSVFNSENNKRQRAKSVLEAEREISD